MHECRSAVKSLGHNPPTPSTPGNERWDTDNTHKCPLCPSFSPWGGNSENLFEKHSKAAIMIPETSSPAKVFHADGSPGGTTPARPTERYGDRGQWTRTALTCYDSLVFGVQTRAKSHDGRRIKARAEGVLMSSDVRRLTPVEPKACDLQQGAVLHENKDRPLTNECVFHRDNSRPDLQGFTVNAAWPRCQLWKLETHRCGFTITLRFSTCVRVWQGDAHKDTSRTQRDLNLEDFLRLWDCW